MRVGGASSVLASLVLLLTLAAPPVARAQKAVMEGVNASRYTIKVDISNGRVDIATTSYNWGIANVGLHVGSNSVVDSLSAHNAIVLYATGTVVAKTFQGDGSGLTNITATGGATLGGPNAFTGADTRSGSLTILSGSSITLNTGSTLVANNIIHNSSTTLVPATTVTQTTFKTCVTTVTATIGANPVQVWASGDIIASAGTGVNAGVSFEEDGHFVGILGASLGVRYSAGSASCGGSECWFGAWSYIYTPSASGAHSWCLTMRSSSGTMKYANDANSTGQFGVMELK